MVKRRKKLCKALAIELNSFAEETSIHGFTYLSHPHHLCSKLSWTALLAAAFSLAIVMIGQNFRDTAAHPLSTTLDTVSVTQVPFPAITIHPGTFRNEKALFKRMFDYLALERYNKNDQLRNNTEFQKIWQNSLTKNNWIDKFIQETKLTIKNDQKFMRKKGMFKNIAAILAAAEKQDIRIVQHITKSLDEAIMANMFKFRYFSQVLNLWIRGILEPIIKEAQTTYNITDLAVSVCKRKDCDKIREKYELLLLTPLYLFMDEDRAVDIGAGHFLSTNEIDTQLKTDMTDAINNASRGSLPYAVFDYARLFTDLYNFFFKEKIYLLRRHTLGYTLSKYYQTYPQNKCDLSMYADFWYAYIYWNGTVVLMCPDSGKCDPKDMTKVRNLDIEPSFTCNPKSDCMKTVQLDNHPCQDQTLAAEYGFLTCCDFNRNISANRAAMLKVLKFTIQSPHLLESEEEEMSLFPNMSQALPSYRTLKNSEDNRRNFNPFIPLCQYNGEPEVRSFRSCNLFSRAYTDMGVGYSFNTEKFEFIYKQNQGNMDSNQALFFNNKKYVQYPKSSGKNYQLQIVIDANSEEVERFEKEILKSKKMPRPFLLSAHDPSSPANLRAEGIEVAPGYETTILITPRLLETTENAKTTLDSNERRCKTKQENQGLEVFKTYTQESCLLECNLKSAASHCGCTPWSYPLVPGSLLCDALGIHCFEKDLEQMDNRSTCDCPNDCDDVTFSLVASAKLLDEKLLCPLKTDSTDLFYHFYQHDALPKKFLGLYNFIVNKQEYKGKELCVKNLKYRAVVNFQLATRSVSRTTQDLRQSFADKLSTFGKLKYV